METFFKRGPVTTRWAKFRTPDNTKRRGGRKNVVGGCGQFVERFQNDKCPFLFWSSRLSHGVPRWLVKCSSGCVCEGVFGWDSYLNYKRENRLPSPIWRGLIQPGRSRNRTKRLTFCPVRRKRLMSDIRLFSPSRLELLGSQICQLSHRNLHSLALWVLRASDLD